MADAAEEPLEPAEIGRSLPGRFTGLERLGKPTGQGQVFRGWMTGKAGERGPQVALKVYSAEHLEERWEREVEALRTLKGDTLIALLDAGRCTVRGQPCVFLVTEYIEGRALSDRIKEGPMSLGEIASVARDVAEAIGLLWKSSIVHRDIKPDNIMLRANGRAVVIDLGVARHLTKATVTDAGMTYGTRGYMSPEHMRAQKNLTCRSDIFALGIVVQEALLGHHPTSRDQRVLGHGGPRTDALVEGLPAAFCALVDRMVTGHAHLRPRPEVVVEAMEQFR